MRVFESGVLREIFESKREEERGDWRKFHNMEFRDFYSTDVIRVTKWRRIKWVSHVARMLEKANVCRVRWGSMKERGHLADLEVV